MTSYVPLLARMTSLGANKERQHKRRYYACALIGNRFTWRHSERSATTCFRSGHDRAGLGWVGWGPETRPSNFRVTWLMRLRVKRTELWRSYMHHHNSPPQPPVLLLLSPKYSCLQLCGIQSPIRNTSVIAFRGRESNAWYWNMSVLPFLTSQTEWASQHRKN